MLKIVTVKMPEDYVNALDELVEMGLFTSRSEAIRVAVRDLLKRELWERVQLRKGSTRRPYWPR
ncbi:MAG: CopG family transcriptional regulator [Thermoprotei archaeon]|nr:MAG: CopG family transcriptional regulator [Thermoprotei archaeon]RLF25136.1 MAG: CopG family transcriptional regulator [Thermoprotei archaeon]